MNAKLEKFIKDTKPKKRVSKLSPFAEDIETLISKNFTQQQIVDYLSIEENITVSRQSLSSWLKKKSESDIKTSTKQAPSSKSTQAAKRLTSMFKDKKDA
ncbi:MAG: hypothetical protein COA39_000115 [Sulfurimonas sp.]|nr:hypothetical protein [Sulfurimonas sp.]